MAIPSPRISSLEETIYWASRQKQKQGFSAVAGNPCFFWCGDWTQTLGWSAQLWL